MPELLRVRCIVAGDAASGKSALTQVFHSDGAHYPKNYNLTTGVELCVKAVLVPDTTDSVEMYIYDCAGKGVFSDIIQNHWKKASLFMIVYDVTNESSFNSCARWIEEVRSVVGSSITGVIVATKIDLKDRRVISESVGRKFAETQNMEYFECSAKETINVDGPFHFLAKEYYKFSLPSL